MEIMVKGLEFFNGKRIFITGHTGFKGIWLCKILEMAGAEVTGYSLPSPTIEGEKFFYILWCEFAYKFGNGRYPRFYIYGKNI